METICTCLIQFNPVTTYIKSIDHYMIGSEKDVTKAAGNKATAPDDTFMELTQIVSPNLPISELKDNV